MQNFNNILIASYGMTLYRNTTYQFKDHFEGSLAFPGLALFDYLLSNKSSKKISRFILLGTSHSLWFNFILNFQEFCKKHELIFNFDHEIIKTSERPNINSKPKSFNTDEPILCNEFCTEDSLKEIEAKVDQFLFEHFKCHFNIIIHSDNVDTLESQTSIIQEIYEYRDLLKQSQVYFDVTCGMRFIPLLILTCFNCLSITHGLEIKGIYYAQEIPNQKALFKNFDFLNRQFREASVLNLFKHNLNIFSLSHLVKDIMLKIKLQNFNCLYNISSYDLAITMYLAALPLLQKEFENSAFFNEQFFNSYFNLLTKNIDTLITLNYYSKNYFNIISLCDFNYPQIWEKPFGKANADNFRSNKNAIRDPIIHYTRMKKDSEKSSIRDQEKYDQNLARFLKDNNLIDQKLYNNLALKKSCSIKPILFSFLGSGNYQDVCYVSHDFGNIKTNFLGNAIAYELASENKISKYIVCGTATSSWKTLINNIGELFKKDLPCLQEIRHGFDQYKTFDESKNTECIILNSEAVTKINHLFSIHKESLGLEVQIFIYDESSAINNDYEDLAKFIKGQLQEQQDFYMEITHSYRIIPIISLLTSYAVSIIKNSKLLKLYYGYTTANFAHSSNQVQSGNIVDLSYLLSLYQSVQDITSFAQTMNLQYLLPTLKEFFGEENNIVKNISQAVNLENATYFQSSYKKYQEVIKDFTHLSNSQVNPIYKLIEPMILEKIKSFTWNDNNIESLEERVRFYVKYQYYANAFFLLYEIYKNFSKQIRKLNSNFENSSSSFQELFKPFHNQINQHKEKDLSDKGNYEKDSILAKSLCKIALPKGNAYPDIQKIRRYLTNEYRDAEERSAFQKKYFNYEQPDVCINFDKVIKKAFANIEVLKKLLHDLNLAMQGKNK